MLARRLLSAAIGIPLLILVVLVGGRVYDTVLASAIFLATAEVLLQAGLPARSVHVWLAAAAAAALIVLSPAGTSLAWGLLGTAIVVLGTCAAAARAHRRFGAWLLPAAVVIYVGWLGQYLGLLRHLPEGSSWAFLVLFVTFASDSGAYFAGRLWGRRRLTPRVSPGKTVEGAIGGVLAAAAAAVALSRLPGLHQRAEIMLLVGAGLSLAAQAGDLLESALKRALAVKDAGILVPGHGGLLDRLDSLLLAGTVLYYLVKWISL